MLLRPPISTLFPYTTLFRSLSYSVKTMPCSNRCSRTLHLSSFVALVDTSFASSGRGSRDRESPLRRSEEHTSELQSHSELVCRLLLEKKKKRQISLDKSKVR